MQKKIDYLTEFLNLSEIQAKHIVVRYLKDIKNFEAFIDFYFDTCLSEKLVGTTFEKLRMVCKLAEIEFKTRFLDKEVFKKWLFSKYKNEPVFRTFEKEFSYSYEKYKNNQKITIIGECVDALYYVNNFKELCYKDGESILNHNPHFYEALIDFIFKNQNRLGKDLVSIEIKQVKQIPSLEQSYLDFKNEQKKLFFENQSKFKANLNLNLRECL